MSPARSRCSSSDFRSSADWRGGSAWSSRESGSSEAETTIRRKRRARRGIVTAQGAMVGETATTAERLREASALAAAGAWLAVTQRNATAEGLLRKLEAMGMLPAGAVIAADKGNALATPYGALIFHYRAAPIGVEALSLGRNKAAGPALIVRVAADMPAADGLKVWSSTRLDNVQLPRPFADESEVIAAGWQAEKLAAGQ